MSDLLMRADCNKLLILLLTILIYQALINLRSVSHIDRTATGSLPKIVPGSPERAAHKQYPTFRIYSRYRDDSEIN
jgi:hypothetical protein